MDGALPNWRDLLERFAGSRAGLPATGLRASGALRRLQAAGARVGVSTDAPEPLARVALAQLVASRTVDAVETGAGALGDCPLSSGRKRGCFARPVTWPPRLRKIRSVTDRKTFDDRQLDAILERLDALRVELQTMNRRLDHNEGFLALAHEVRSLNESLQALAYAALGQQGPQVRRRRTG